MTSVVLTVPKHAVFHKLILAGTFQHFPANSIPAIWKFSGLDTKLAQSGVKIMQPCHPCLLKKDQKCVRTTVNLFLRCTGGGKFAGNAPHQLKPG